jgi:hypothetical protein
MLPDVAFVLLNLAESALAGVNRPTLTDRGGANRPTRVPNRSTHGAIRGPVETFHFGNFRHFSSRNRQLAA